MMTRVAMQMFGLLELAILLGATGAVASGARGCEHAWNKPAIEVEVG
jgi:hypothetical protein